jgi:solute:Na+ symporter, SSS family
VTYWIPMCVVLAYLALLFVVTWWAQRMMRRTSSGLVGYLLAGRQMPAGVCAAALAGLAVGGASTIGVAERAYKSGISAGWYNAAWAAGALLTAVLAIRRYRRFEVSTLPELFERFYTPSGRVIAVLGQLAIQIVITSLQYVAGGAILSSLMPQLFTLRSGMVATAVVFIVITLIGGFWAAGLTNVVNVVVIYVGICIGAVITLGRVGGFDGLVADAPASYPGYDLAGVGAPIIAAWFLVMAMTTMSTQSVVQIGMAAKDERAAQRGFLIGAALIVPVGFISALLGMAARVLHPGIAPAEALPRIVLEMPPLVAGIILAGLWAADVSTATALLIGSATLVTNDVVKRFVSKELTPRGEAWVSRTTVLAIGLVTFVLALSVSGILKTLLVGLTLTTGYTIVALMTMYWPAACRRGTATWTLLGTMVALVLWHVAPVAAVREALPPTLRWLVSHPIYFVFVAGLLSFFAVALLDKRRIVATPGDARQADRGVSEQSGLVGSVEAGAQGWGNRSGQ